MASSFANVAKAIIRPLLEAMGKTEHRVALRDDMCTRSSPRLKLGSWLCLYSGCVGRKDGKPVKDMFRIEAVVIRRRTTHVALRWYASHEDVVGIAPDELARTTLWQMPRLQNLAHRTVDWEAASRADMMMPVDYVHELLATREELRAAGVVFDDRFWSPEHFLCQWARDAPTGPHADPLVRRLRPIVSDLRQAYIARPRCMPKGRPRPPAPAPAPSAAAEAVFAEVSAEIAADLAAMRGQPVNEAAPQPPRKRRRRIVLREGAGSSEEDEEDENEEGAVRRPPRRKRQRPQDPASDNEMADVVPGLLSLAREPAQMAGEERSILESFLGALTRDRGGQ
eukprot:m51a1_g5096 hypothetical protein (339) ;mRNA; r:281683-283141